MFDYPAKVFSILLIFMMCALSPFLSAYMESEALSNRLALNEVEMFLDKVTDKATITQADLDDLYLAIAATGGIYDVEVKRLIRLSTKLPDDSVRTLYLSQDYIGETMKSGDLVKVTVTDIGLTPAKRLKWYVLRLDEGKFHFSLTASVGR